MRADPVSTRYVEALFSLARRTGSLETVRADVERVAAELRSPAVKRMLSDPRLSSQQRLERFKPLVETLGPLTAKFVRLLFSKGRELVLLELGQAFRQRLLHEASAVEGVVETARPLDGAEIDRLASALSRQLDKKVYLENALRPDLIGGFRVRVGHRMLDRSVHGRLEQLREQMLAAPLAAPRSN